jgi:hypothetical protein
MLSRFPVAALSVALLLAGPSAARKPQLTPAAAALLTDDKAGGLFLVAEDNLAVPIAGRGKGVPFLTVKATRLEVISSGADGVATLAIDDEVFRLEKGALTPIPVKGKVGAMPAVSADGKLVASVEEKKILRLFVDGAVKPVSYRRPGRWELEHPYISADGSALLVALRDYTQPLDAYNFLLVDPKSGDVEEIRLAQNTIPGALRVPLGNSQVGIPMYTQGTDEGGFANLMESDLVVLDFKTKKLEPAPKTMRPGRPSPSGKYSIAPGTMRYSNDKRCGGDETRLYQEGKEGKAPLRFTVGEGSVASALDFLPDESGLIANILQLKTCKNRGVIIPLARDDPPSKWAPFALPVREGHLTGRVLYPAKK